MNREIRFRAWDKKNKEMLIVEGLSFSPEYNRTGGYPYNYCSVEDNYEYTPNYHVNLVYGDFSRPVPCPKKKYECDYEPVDCDIEDIELMQFTGLTDKNGKEIYEGDILKINSRMDSAKSVVIFEKAEFRQVLIEEYKDYKTDCGYFNINNFDKEVIGNIYENLELVEAKND